MKNNKTLVEFIVDPDSSFLKARYDRIKEETGKYLVTSAKSNSNDGCDIRHICNDI